MENVGAADAGAFIANGGGEGGAALAEGAGGSGAAEALVEAIGAADAAADVLGTGAVTEALGLAVVRFVGVAAGDEQLQSNTPVSGQDNALRKGMEDHGATEHWMWARFLGKNFWELGFGA
jgi:hypothetical protein